jgi:hypothetical protein
VQRVQVETAKVDRQARIQFAKGETRFRNTETLATGLLALLPGCRRYIPLSRGVS